MKLAALSFTSIVLVLAFTGCSTNRQVTTEQKIIDGVAVKVTSSRNGERTWTRFDLAQSVPVTRGGAIPQGSLMRRPGFHSPIAGENLHAFVLKRNTKFGDVACRGFFEFDTYFDANWNLRVCPLDGDHIIDGVPCKKTSVSSWRETRRRTGTDPTAVFYVSGRLQKCIASRSFERGDVSYEEWQVVRLREDGTAEP